MNALRERRVQVAILAVAGLVIATALLTGLLTARASKASVGYLRIQDVLSNWPSFIEANEQFNEYANQLQADYKERLEKATDEEKESLLKEIQDKMQKTNDEMVEPYDKILERAVDEARRHFGLDVVLTPDYVISGGLDVTEKVTSLVLEYSETVE